MANNFVQPGGTVTFIGLSGDHLSGEFTVIGSLFGVCAFNVAESAEGELTTGGVWRLPKATGNALTQGQKVYWDATAKKMTGTASTNLLVGVAVLPELSAATEVTVRLNDNFTV